MYFSCSFTLRIETALEDEVLIKTVSELEVAKSIAYCFLIYVIHLASSKSCFQYALNRFTAGYDNTVIKIGTKKPQIFICRENSIRRSHLHFWP